jgi:hypothetical protein
MRALAAYLTLLTTVFFAASCSNVTNPVRPQEPSGALSALEASLAGTWEGTLKRRGEKQAESQLRLLIARDQARVFLRKGNAWVEMKPGQFTITRLGPNAVLSATDSGRDEESLWVETLVMALTLKTNDHLLVEFVRMVHNIDLPESSDHKRFSFSGVGVFDRRPGGS